MENIKVSDKVSTSHLIPINVGTLAIIIIVVVTSCTLLTLLFLYCWRRMSSDSNLSCARCHQIIAVQGPEKPRQLVQQYFVVQPQARAQQQQLQLTFGQQPGQSGPAVPVGGHHDRYPHYSQSYLSARDSNLARKC